MNRPEQDLQKAVVRTLRVCLQPPPEGPFIFAPDPGVQMGGQHAARIGGIRKSMGVRAGVPDLMFVWRGKAIGIELKRADGRLTKEQKEAHADLTLAGAVVTTARSVDEVLEFLTTLGMPIRGRVA